MRTYIKFTLLFILSFGIFLLIAALFVPKSDHISKTVIIDAPLDSVWENINSLEDMKAWNPWFEQDPNLQTSYEGKSGEVGSIFRWKGNDLVGQGNQIIVSLEPRSRIDSRFNIIRPYKSKAEESLQLYATSKGTQVIWDMESIYDYPLNLLILVNSSTSLGKKIETGLMKLKKMSEKKN